MEIPDVPMEISSWRKVLAFQSWISCYFRALHDSGRWVHKHHPACRNWSPGLYRRRRAAVLAPPSAPGPLEPPPGFAPKERERLRERLKGMHVEEATTSIRGIYTQEQYASAWDNSMLPPCSRPSRWVEPSTVCLLLVLSVIIHRIKPNTMYLLPLCDNDVPGLFFFQIVSRDMLELPEQRSVTPGNLETFPLDSS